MGAGPAGIEGVFPNTSLGIQLRKDHIMKGGKLFSSSDGVNRERQNLTFYGWLNGSVYTGA
jgi:hypothetical protein